MAVSTNGELWIVRHGATAWSLAGRHTSYTDIALEQVGEQQARALGKRLNVDDFDLALSSPRQRALRTAELAGFIPEIEHNLVEWNYGEYEGITTPEIRQTVPGWTVFSASSPGGETADEVGVRADQVIARVTGRTLVFTHGHFGRVLVARWLGLPVGAGRYFKLETATISVLGHEREQPVVRRWNA